MGGTPQRTEDEQEERQGLREDVPEVFPADRGAAFQRGDQDENHQHVFSVQASAPDPKCPVMTSNLQLLHGFKHLFLIQQAT